MSDTTNQDAAYRKPGTGEEPTHVHVVLDDDTEFVVRTGNRELVAWDRTMSRKYDRDKQAFIFANFLAWFAAQREGFFGGPFDTPGGFLDRADKISPLVLVTDDGDGAARPTRTAAQPD